MARASPEAFQALCAHLGARSAVRRWRAALIEAHRTPPRAYHDLDHVEACLLALDELRDEAAHPAAVELALWFHDAVYDPRRQDNEARSAALARKAAGELGLALTLTRTVETLVLATAHRQPPQSADERVIVDADLSILGAPAEAYDRYERAIRLEYSFVPDEAFRAGRTALLRHFLDQPRIFHTRRYSERLEARARANLAGALEELAREA